MFFLLLVLILAAVAPPLTTALVTRLFVFERAEAPGKGQEYANAS
jgi:hypothetical protein